MITLFLFVNFRTTWTVWPQTGGDTAKQSDQRTQRSRDLQSRSSEKRTRLLFQNSRPAPIPQRSESVENFGEVPLSFSLSFWIVSHVIFECVDHFVLQCLHPFGVRLPTYSYFILHSYDNTISFLKFQNDMDCLIPNGWRHCKTKWSTHSKITWLTIQKLREKDKGTSPKFSTDYHPSDLWVSKECKEFSSWN